MERARCGELGFIGWWRGLDLELEFLWVGFGFGSGSCWTAVWEKIRERTQD